jgi:hypothetical protein
VDAKETQNDVELKKVVEEKILQRMTKVHNYLEMWQGNQNLHVTQKKSRGQYKQMTAIGHISDTEKIIKASCSHLQHVPVTAFKLSERSLLPPSSSAM